jgi:hypothetical protein
MKHIFSSCLPAVGIPLLPCNFDPEDSLSHRITQLGLTATAHAAGSKPMSVWQIMEASP